MKKFMIMISALLCCMFTAPMVQAFTPTGEAMVTPYVTTTEMDKAVGGVSKEIKSLRGTVARQGKNFKTAVNLNTAAVTTLAINMKELAVATGQNNEKFRLVTNQAKDNAVILIVLIVFVFGVVMLLISRNRRHTTDHTTTAILPVANNTAAILQAVNALGTNVNSRFDAVDKGIKDLPTAISTLDPKPFEFEVAGHKVTYQSPVEGISEGYYLLLHVPKDMTGDVADYHRDHETNRGVAIRSCRKTMQQYFEGKFNAHEYKLQKDLINHLISTKEISFRKIS